MMSISKKAILIPYPGEPDGDNYCPGVFADIENYKNFLCSPLGGWWRFDKDSDVCSEIKIFPSPKRNILLPYLERLKSYDYIIIAFCGHGRYSRLYQQTIIQINEHEEVRESELRDFGIRENLVLDCCRVLLPDIVTDAMEHFGLRKASAHHRELNFAECRKYYEKSISECRPGCNVLYGCNVGESSGESKSSGGYYSSSLFRVARNWEREMNESLSPDEYSVLSIPSAHLQAIPLVKAKKTDQTPQISPNAIDFPWAIATY